MKADTRNPIPETRHQSVIRIPQSEISSDAVLADFLTRIEPVRLEIQRLTLFGSRARGDHRSDSDYDVLVLVAKKEDHLLDALYEAVMDVLLTHGRLISLKVFEAQEFARLQAMHTPFTEHMASEGIVL